MNVLFTLFDLDFGPGMNIYTKIWFNEVCSCHERDIFFNFADWPQAWLSYHVMILLLSLAYCLNAIADSTYKKPNRNLTGDAVWLVDREFTLLGSNGPEEWTFANKQYRRPSSTVRINEYDEILWWNFLAPFPFLHLVLHFVLVDLIFHRFFSRHFSTSNSRLLDKKSMSLVPLFKTVPAIHRMHTFLAFRPSCPRRLRAFHDAYHLIWNW